MKSLELHVKPTQEELAAKAAKALEEAEALKGNPPAPEPEPTPSKPPEPEPTPSLPPEPSPSKPPEPEPTPSKPPEPEPSKPAPSPDYKERYKQSTAEAQILAARNKAMNEAVLKASNLPEPTEAELEKEAQDKKFDWDLMSDIEKNSLKEALISKRYRDTINEGTKEFLDWDVWKGKVDTFLLDPKTAKTFSELNGKEDDFRSFALQMQRKGTPFEDLVGSYLFHLSKDKPALHKGKMFDDGTGGPSNKPKLKTDILTVEQGKALMESDYKLWKEKLKEHKIAFE